MVSDKHIRWSEKETEYTDKKQSVAGMLLWWLLGAWFAFVTRQMIAEGVAVGTDPSGMAFKCLVLLVTFAIVWGNRRIGRISGKFVRIIGNVLIIIGCAVVLVMVYGRSNSDLPGGLMALVRMYADHWKKNFGVDLGVAYGNINAGGAALDFVILVAVLVVLCAAVGMKKSVWLSVMPLSVVGLSLLVNVKPQWGSLALLFIGIVVAIYLDRVAVFRLKQLSLLILVLGFIVGLMPRIMKEPAEHVYEIKEDYLALQKNLEQAVKDFDLQQFFTDNVSVTNEAPEYEEKEVMLLLMNELPTDSIFLRGYHCSRYLGGAWERGNDAFVRSCKEQGLEEAQASKMLLQQPYDAYTSIGERVSEYTLKYTDLEEKTAYLPYGTDTGTSDAAYELSGDYQATKSKRTKEYTVQSVGYTSTVLIFNGQELTQQEKAFYKWYGDFVEENYMDVPDDQKTAKELAREIKNSSEYKEDYKLYMDMLSYTPGSAMEKNWSRTLLTALVKARLEQEYTYSLELEELAPGQDPVEYFLGTSKEGYCVHFASAAVMILREMGVPARYTSGYLVTNNKIRRQDGMYAFSVKDSASHAWVEIYLEEYGWMPWDVTPGYNNMDDVQSESEHQEEQEQTEASESTASEETEVWEESSEEEASEETVDKESVDEGDFGPGTDTGTEGTGNVSSKHAVLILVMLSVLVIGIIGWKVRKGKGIDRSRLNTYIRRGDTRRAVLLMNRQIYRTVSGFAKKGQISSDAEYFSVLQNAFPDMEKKAWENYFETVRRATYSKADISEEDVRECYKIYYEITQKDN